MTRAKGAPALTPFFWLVVALAIVVVFAACAIAAYLSPVFSIHEGF